MFKAFGFKSVLVLHFLLASCLHANDVQILDGNIRHAFFRGETASLSLSVENQSEAAIGGAVLSVDFDGFISQSANLGEITANGKASHLFRVDTALLKSGEYDVVCELRSSDAVLATKEIKMWVARKWNPERMRVWLWAHRRFGTKTWKLDEEAQRQLEWYSDKGFNSFTPGGGSYGKYGLVDENKYKLFDYGMVNGYEMGFDGIGFLDSIKVIEEMKDPFVPEVAKFLNDSMRKTMQVVKEFPGVGICFLNSEYEDRRKKEVASARQYLAEPYGPVAKHEYILPGVIADNDAKYYNKVYHYKWGDGITETNTRLLEIIKQYRPDMFVLADPLRKTVVYDRFKGLDAVSTWSYTNPDPKYMLFIETLIANAKPQNQGVVHTVTMLNYPGSIAAKDRGWTLMGPDRFVETSWINLSRRPDMLSVYIGSGCDPFESTWEGVGVKEGENITSGYPNQHYPESFEAFKKFNNDVVKPFGPMISNLERSKRKVAILSSESSRVYSDSPGLVGHYSNYQIYSFYSLLNMIHVPTDVIFDETIVKYGLDGYDVLVLAKCDTLTKTVYDKIIEFKNRGGKIISDQYLRAPIPVDRKFDFDFTYRSNVSANAIIERKDYAVKTDYMGERAQKLQAVKGVTALEDQQRMESYAKELRAGLEGLFEREVDCSSATALMNVLEKDGVKYLFVVNDKRTYGDRFGQYKSMLEKVVEQTVEISLADSGDQQVYAYDLLANKTLEMKSVDGKQAFKLDLPAPGGKIVMLSNQKLAAVEVAGDKTPAIKGQAKKFDILIKDQAGGLMKGVVPVKVTIVDPAGDINEFSDYYAAKSGLLSLDFVAGLNDASGKWKIEVQELMTGKKYSAFFDVK